MKGINKKEGQSLGTDPKVGFRRECGGLDRTSPTNAHCTPVGGPYPPPQGVVADRFLPPSGGGSGAYEDTLLRSGGRRRKFLSERWQVTGH